jgi:hypothetical protein
MNKILRVIILVLALCAWPCLAWTDGSGGGGVPQVILSVGNSDLPGICINWFKCATESISTNSPSVLDANQYPNASAPTANISLQVLGQPTLSYYSGTWEEGWSGTGAHSHNETLIMVSDPQNCTGVGTGRTFSTISGKNCDVVFNYQSNPTGSGFLPYTHTYSSMSRMFLIRSTDKKAYLAGQAYTPEWLAIVSSTGALKPLALRTMGMTFPQQAGAYENSAGWAYRTQLTSLAWNNAQWIPNIWSSSVTGTDQYIASAAADTPAQWTDSEMLQACFAHASAAGIAVSAFASYGGLVEATVSSTSTLTTNQNVLVTNYSGTLPMTVYQVTVIDGTHVTLQRSTYSSAWNITGPNTLLITTTINVGSRGAKPIIGYGFIDAAGITAGGCGTLVYDALLGVEIYTPGGINSGVPFEALVTMANEAKVPLWANIPPYYQTSDVISLVDYISSNLNHDLFLEYNNENWNLLFQNQWFIQRGYAIGLPLSSNNGSYSAAGLKIRQLMAPATSAWSSSHTLHRINAASTFVGGPSTYALYQFSGSTLCGTSCGNSTYQAKVGTDYNAYPNRPQDYSDAYSIATYFSGAQENGNDGSITSLLQLRGIITAATEYADGDTTDGFAFVDNDIRRGTCGGCTGAAFTIASLQSSVYPGWNTRAHTDGKTLYSYEGGFSSYGQTAAFLSGLGDSNASIDARNINNLLIAYRSSSLFYSTYIYQNQVWFGFSQVRGNSNLQVGNPYGTIGINSQYWGLLAGSYFPAMPYQSYYATGAIN